MSELKRRIESSGSALANRGQKRDKAITTHKTNLDTTNNVNPTPMRLTIQDKSDLDDWCSDIQQHMRKKVTQAKVVRGMIAIKDELPPKVQAMLIDAIKEL